MTATSSAEEHLNFGALTRRVAKLEAEAEIARRLAAFETLAPDRVRIYRFIESEAASFPIRSLCRVTKVSPSAYYAWRSRSEQASAALVQEAALANQIFDIWQHSRHRYGAPRVTAALLKAGAVTNEKRVARLMAELGIANKSGRRKLHTTMRDLTATPAPDMVERDFTAEAPDELWLGDIKCRRRHLMSYADHGTMPTLLATGYVKGAFWAGWSA